jgi:hypothetical protein
LGAFSFPFPQRPVINGLAVGDVEAARLGRLLSVAISARHADPYYDVMQTGVQKAMVDRHAVSRPPCMHACIHPSIHSSMAQIIGAGLSQLEVCLLIGAMVLTQPPHSFEVRAIACAPT